MYQHNCYSILQYTDSLHVSFIKEKYISILYNIIKVYTDTCFFYNYETIYMQGNKLFRLNIMITMILRYTHIA